MELIKVHRLISASVGTVVHYGFQCHPRIEQFFLTCCFLTGLAGNVFPFMDWFNEVKYRVRFILYPLDRMFTRRLVMESCFLPGNGVHSRCTASGACIPARFRASSSFRSPRVAIRHLVPHWPRVLRIPYTRTMDVWRRIQVLPGAGLPWRRIPCYMACFHRHCYRSTQERNWTHEKRARMSCRWWFWLGQGSFWVFWTESGVGMM